MKISPAESYKRWRHTRGYGVHSPFAYMLVKEVVRPGSDYVWYAYTDVDNAMADRVARRYRRQARILLRLAARLAVESAFIPQNVSGPFRAALLGADSRMHIVTAMAEIDRCRLIGTIGDYIPLETLTRLMARPGRILVFLNVPDGWRESLFGAVDEGLMFYSRRNVIVINRPGMQKVAYSVSL